jgi:hypothetical protein
LFLFGFAFTKLAKTTKQNKTNFLTNTRKQIGSNSEGKKKKVALKEKKKRGSRSSPSTKAWRWRPLVPKNNKKRGKKKEKKEKNSSSSLLRPGNAAIDT